MWAAAELFTRKLSSSPWHHSVTWAAQRKTLQNSPKLVFNLSIKLDLSIFQTFFLPPQRDGFVKNRFPNNKIPASEICFKEFFIFHSASLSLSAGILRLPVVTQNNQNSNRGKPTCTFREGRRHSREHPRPPPPPLSPADHPSDSLKRHKNKFKLNLLIRFSSEVFFHRFCDGLRRVFTFHRTLSKREN